MNFIGTDIVDNNEIEFVLNEATVFFSKLQENYRKWIIIEDNYESFKSFKEGEYYLIDNRIIIKGKKRIDKRKVKRVSKNEIINEIKLNFIFGFEPDMILLPVKQYNKKYGIYLQGTICFCFY